MDSIPVEEWFVFRQDAATAYLKKVARGIRWKEASDDPFLAKFGLAEKCGLVHVIPVNPRADLRAVLSCDCGCRGYFPRCKRRGRPPFRCTSRFEMDLGRSNMGHEYAIEVLAGGVTFCRIDRLEARGTRWGTLDDVSPESLLDAIQEIVVEEVIRA